MSQHTPEPEQSRDGTIVVLCAEIAALKQQLAEKQQWIDEAVASCAKRGCSRAEYSAVHPLRQQRDDLLAALNVTAAWLSSFSMPPTSTIQEKQEALSVIEAAIARAEATEPER
jgi:hypothetical protein